MKFELLKEKYNITPSTSVKEKCKKFKEIFLEYNSHTNLMSKNDVKVIFEKHITDSLALSLFDGFIEAKNILDIGTGGGFPSIPLSIFFEDKRIYAIDSIRKKINFVELAKQELSLTNLNPVCSRIEALDDSLKGCFDIVTSRALSTLEQIIKYSLPFVKSGGYIAAYKSKNVNEEIKQAKELIKKSNLIKLETINYTLELEESFERCVVILKKQ